MILTLYIILCIVAAWYTKVPWILLYGLIPLVLQVYCLCNKCDSEGETQSDCEEDPCNEDKDQDGPACDVDGLTLEQKIETWKSIGSPYYLHSDYELVQLLSEVRPKDPRTVHLCNLLMRQVEECKCDNDDHDRTIQNQTKSWYIELINRLEDTNCQRIQNIMYRHIAGYLQYSITYYDE